MPLGILNCKDFITVDTTFKTTNGYYKMLNYSLEVSKQVRLKIKLYYIYLIYFVWIEDEE